MKKQILFIQGGGDDGYEADALLVKSLQKELGDEYRIHYPEIKSDETATDYGWLRQLKTILAETQDDVLIVAHSFGASMLLKYLTENHVSKRIDGIFLIATPFWKGDEDWQKGLMLQQNFAEKLPKNVPLFFYHAHDDQEAPFAHFGQYKAMIKYAMFREVEQGGHQFNNDLKVVADDIKSFHDHDYWP